MLHLTEAFAMPLNCFPMKSDQLVKTKNLGIGLNTHLKQSTRAL